MQPMSLKLHGALFFLNRSLLFLRYDAGDGVAVAFYVRQEGFGGAEVEVHVQADGEVVVVVGDEEGDDFFL